MVELLKVDKLFEDVADEGVCAVSVFDFIPDADDVAALLDEVLEVVVGALVGELG